MIVHMGIDVRGVLGWPDKRLVKLFSNDDGTKANAADVRNFLFDKLKEGYEVIPINDECDNWDKEHGCKGHKKEAE
jgi:hypothetical protein